jgi:adenosine deaminase
MPKLELHCHLDGSLTLASMSEILGRPVRPEETQVDDDCRDLAEYLDKFQLPLQCVQSAEHLRLASREFLLDAAKEQVCYMEVRFAPLSSVNSHLDTRQVIEAVLEGLAEAEKICHVSYNVIACAMRHQSDEENLAMMKVCREYLGEGICAVDLAGNEAAYPMKNFRELFAGAKKLGFPFTIHAGECGSVENVLEAVGCGAARIGHGIALRGHEEAIRFCADRGIGIEMCPVSNLQTKAATEKDYPIREFIDAGLRVTLNTDNRTVSHTSLTREMEFVQEHYGITDEELYQLQRNALDTAFADDQTKDRLWKKIRRN